MAACALGACGTGDVTTPHPSVTSGDSAVRLVDEDDAALMLFVSNQSFEDDTVRLTVAVDGVTVVDDDFRVEGQHNWIAFPLALPAGRHILTAESDSGATLQKSFRVPPDARRFAVVDYSTDDGSRRLTWRFSKEPVGFA